MNLGKLLGAGKSFFSGGGGISYRENKRAYLPKFNAGKNPFTAKPVEAAPAAAARFADAPLSALDQSRKITVTEVPQPTQVMPTRAISWKDKLNPFRSPEPVRPALVNAVQAELSLEAVKVVHNDLADADIEVVPVKSRTPGATETPALPPARSSWDFLGERLMKQA